MAGRGRSSGIELRRIVSGGPANVSKRRTLASFCIGVVPNPGIFACGCGLRMNLLAVRRRHAEERGVAWAYPHRFPGHRSGKYRRGVLVLAYRTGVQGAEHGPRNADSTLLIDATRKRPIPLLVLPAHQYMEGVRCLCQQLGLPPLTAESTWHGCTLGDWTATWEAHARRAAVGDWM
jgi:hypothetical protein